MADILIVDDEKNLRWSLKIALEEKGHRVDEVGSGEECLEHLASTPKVRIDERVVGPVADLFAIDGFKPVRGNPAFVHVVAVRHR